MSLTVPWGSVRESVLPSKSSEDVEGMHIKSADDTNLEGEPGQGGGT